MAIVFEIVAEFGRKIQVREYEPAEGKVTIKAQIGEGEDAAEAANSLVLTARAAVMNGLSQTPVGAAIVAKAAEAQAKTATTGGEPAAGTKTAPAATVEKAKPGRPSTKKEAAPPADKAPATSEIPGDDPVVEEKTAAAGESEIPDDKPAEKPADKAPAKAAESGALTAQELQQYVSKLLGEKKITAPQVKELISAKGVARMGDLDAAQLSALKDEIDVLTM